ELANLLSVGIITSDANNNRLYYEVSQKFEFYQPLAQIFGGAPVSKAPAKKAKAAKSTAEPEKAVDVAPEHPLAKDVRGTGRVNLAILTGQFTRDDLAGVDVLLVGDLNQAKVTRFINELEQSENKELRYTTMPMSDFNYRVQIHDRFINNVLEAKK